MEQHVESGGTPNSPAVLECADPRPQCSEEELDLFAAMLNQLASALQAKLDGSDAAAPASTSLVAIIIYNYW